VANTVALLLLQHPLEAQEAKGTARLLQLSLARCTVWVGERFDPAALAKAIQGAALLYPADEGAACISPAVSTSAMRPTGLVVIDATWRKSRKMLALNPLLQALPRVALAAGDMSGSRYAPLRRAHRPGQLSTLEASVLALQQLEPEPARYEPLLAAFDGFVAAHVAARFPHQTGPA